MSRNRGGDRLRGPRRVDLRTGRGTIRTRTRLPIGPPTAARLVSADEAVPAVDQHRTPCGDCPWRRDALPGWLGSLSADDWLRAAHGEATADCHTLTGAQCAGLATYRANVCKRPRNPAALQLGPDRDTVFAGPAEFRDYHHKLTVGEENE